MAKRSPYEVIGVDREATAADIKAAYRKLAKILHPDAHRGAQGEEKKAIDARFAELNDANEILKDPDKRAAYDRYGWAAFERGGPTNASAPNSTGMGAPTFADLFEGLFRNPVGGRSQNSGASPFDGLFGFPSPKQEKWAWRATAEGQKAADTLFEEAFVLFTDGPAPRRKTARGRRYRDGSR